MKRASGTSRKANEEIRVIRTVQVIDIFAGPGGLGEGFESHDKGDIRFRIALSIEKEQRAHKTLQLRSFFRQFPKRRVPPEYYQYIQGEIPLHILRDKYPEEMSTAEDTAWCAELGEISEKEVDSRISNSLDSDKEWVLIGGPPCQAYSLAGRSRMSKVWENNPNIKEKDPRHFLYKEYLRIIGKHSPAVFVMENVKGILTAEFKGEPIFSRIISDLKNPGSVIASKGEKSPKYRLYSFVHDSDGEPNLFCNTENEDPRQFIIKSEEYGIPQRRHRVIIFGIRTDIDVQPGNLLKKHGEVSVQEAIADLPSRKSSISGRNRKAMSWDKTIQATPDCCAGWDSEHSTEVIDCMKKHMSKTGKKSIRGKKVISPLVRKYREFVQGDLNVTKCCNHEPRSHMPSDIQRYFFAACFAEIADSSPRLKNFPRKLLPAHKNVEEGIKKSKFADRFRVQLRYRPSTTITCHISKDGHYYIHPDPQQCRSLTVREAARLQTFPDNYFFEGPRTSQYVQVGNAVPPLLAYQLADIVAGIMKHLND